MFKALCLGVVLVLVLSGCASVETKGEPALTPTAKNIFIYSSGGGVVAGDVDPAAIGSGRLRFPPTAKNIKLYHDNEVLKWFTIQMSPRANERDAPAHEKYQLIGFPLPGEGRVSFEYALPEITWLPLLTASILDKKTVALRVQAAITMGANQAFEKCNLTLVLNNAMSLQSLSGQTFNLNSFDLFPYRNVMYSLENRNVDYRFIREWNTYAGGDTVFIKLLAKNPFPINLSQTRYTVDYRQVNIDYGTLGTAARPGDDLYLDARSDNSIKTFRAVKITENRENKHLPFNHHIAYTIQNTSDEHKTLHLVSQRITGNEHRSIYHFRTQPDATPENTLIWILELAPHGSQTLEYDYDADVKDVPGESGFEQGG